MASITLTISDDKVQLVLDAFAAVRGISATATAVKKELVDEIKNVVKQYKLQRLASGQESSLTQSGMEVNVT